jgi:hypothetical protein
MSVTMEPIKIPFALGALTLCLVYYFFKIYFKSSFVVHQSIAFLHGLPNHIPFKIKNGRTKKSLRTYSENYAHFYKISYISFIIFLKSTSSQLLLLHIR